MSGQPAEDKQLVPSRTTPAEAVARMSADQARETEAYTLGVQAVLWGMQWVKAGQTLRAMSSPALGARLGTPDPTALGINVWHHYQTLPRLSRRSRLGLPGRRWLRRWPALLCGRVVERGEHRASRTTRSR